MIINKPAATRPDASDQSMTEATSMISIGGERRVSFPAEDDMIGGFLGPGDSLEDLEFLAKKSEKELTHFSEEGIADMDIPDHLLEELDFLDNITSCDKVENIIIITIFIIFIMRQVENYLMLSEYEQNLIKEIEGPEGVSTEHWAGRIVFYL